MSIDEPFDVVGTGFSALETAVMAKLLAGPGPVLLALRGQYETSSVSRRAWTGVGFWTDIHVSKSAGALTMIRSLHLSDVVAEMAGLEHGVGFVLHIEDGLLEMLEGYTFDEPWPTSEGTFTLAYTGDEARTATLAKIDQALRHSRV